MLLLIHCKAALRTDLVPATAGLEPVADVNLRAGLCLRTRRNWVPAAQNLIVIAELPLINVNAIDTHLQFGSIDEVDTSSQSVVQLLVCLSLSVLLAPGHRS
jgi:hypothetical protein